MTGKIIFTITGEIEIADDLDDMRAGIDNLAEWLKKIREYGSASLVYTVNAEGKDKG
jgi:hypothetical protein